MREASLGKGKLIFSCTGSRGSYTGSFGQHNNNNNLRFRVGISKNKNNDHRVKETCAVTYETDHISVLCHSTMSSAPNFCFYVFYCDLKEKYRIRRNTNCKTRKVCM